jgi:hypothetical protein
MKPIEQQLQALLKMTVNTADHELTCEASGEILHRYIEFRVSGMGEMPGDLKAVEQHLSVCPDCYEVTEAIIRAIIAERQHLTAADDQ